MLKKLLEHKMFNSAWITAPF